MPAGNLNSCARRRSVAAWRAAAVAWWPDAARGSPSPGRWTAGLNSTGWGKVLRSLPGMSSDADFRRAARSWRLVDPDHGAVRNSLTMGWDSTDGERRCLHEAGTKSRGAGDAGVVGLAEPERAALADSGGVFSPSASAAAPGSASAAGAGSPSRFFVGPGPPASCPASVCPWQGSSARGATPSWPVSSSLASPALRPCAAAASAAADAPAAPPGAAPSASAADVLVS